MNLLIKCGVIDGDDGATKDIQGKKNQSFCFWNKLNEHSFMAQLLRLGPSNYASWVSWGETPLSSHETPFFSFLAMSTS